MSKLRPWIVVAAAFGAMFVAFGTNYSFGVFFGPLQQEFDVGRSAVAWVFGISTAVFLGAGVVAGSIADRFGVRLVFLAGGVLMAAGLVLAARATAIWHVYIGQGVVAGLAMSCLFTTSVAAVGRWFPPQRRGLATGIAVSGSGVGTLVYAPVARALIEGRGWREALTILGLAGGALLVVSAAAVEARGSPVATGMPLAEAVRSRPFRLLWICGLLGAFAFPLPFAHVVPYARDYGMSLAFGSFLLAVMGATGTIGRLGLGAAADRLGHRTMLLATFAGMGGSQALWLFSRTRPPLALFAALYGLFAGGFVTLLGSIVGQYFGTANLAGIFGLLNTGAVPGALFGPPAAGALFDALGSYSVPITLAAIVNFVSFAVLLRLPHPE